MRIALVINCTGSSDDTYSLITRALVFEMLALGHMPVILRARTSRSIPFKSTVFDVPCYSLGFLNAPFHRVVSAFQTAFILWKYKIEVAHVQCNGRDSWGFNIYRALRPTPFILTLHCIGATSVNNIWRRRHFRSLLRHASAVTAVSNSLSEDVCRFYPPVRSKVEVIPNGVDINDSFADTADAMPARPLPDRFILSVGNLSFEKGTDLLLFAYRDFLRDNHSELRLVICGSDHTAGLFEDMASRLGLADRVFFLGPRPHGMVVELMRRCAFFVSPSRAETFGIAIAEAMMLGKGVIAPRVEAVSEYLVDQSNGLLFEPGNASDLASSMAILAANDARRTDLGRQAGARKWAQWSQVCGAYQELYAKALGA